MVRWNLPIEGRRRAEVFTEWAETHPEDIAAMRSKNEKRRQAAFEKLERHCLRVAERARKNLASKDWETFATFDPLIAEELDDCASGTGQDEYEASKLESVLRLQETGAPF